MDKQSDQTEVDSQTEADSNDEDSTMEEVVTIADTPRTVSFAPSDSQDASEESTRASTPTENRSQDMPADLDSLKPFESDDIADDVTMKDLGPIENSPASAADGFGNSKVVSWPSSTVIDPGSSPWKVGTTKVRVAEDGSGPQYLDDLLRLNDPEY